MLSPNNGGQGQITDASNDVVLSLGSDYPGETDLTGASFNRSDGNGRVAITVAGPISNMNEGESVTWYAMLVLENESDVVDMYELWAVLNSTGLHAYIQSVSNQSQQTCQASFEGNQLNIVMPLSGLASSTQVEWNVTSTYEKNSDGELVAAANDFAPDEGMQTTWFTP